MSTIAANNCDNTDAVVVIRVKNSTLLLGHLFVTVGTCDERTARDVNIDISKSVYRAAITHEYMCM
jgi:hypothetical protein